MLKRTIRNLHGLLIFSATTINTIICFVPIFILAVPKFLLPIRPLRALLNRWLMAIGEAWVACNSIIFSLGSSTTFEIRGLENLRTDQWYLVIANHQTWVDIVALQSALNRKIPFLKFFIKQELVWFPFLGAAWWAMDMPFMKRYSKSYLVKHPEKKGKDLLATRKACQKFRDTPTSVINFVEGTRFTDEKRKSRGSAYTHLLTPRAGGVALALSSMGDMFDAILDITIGYPKGPIQFWDMLCGELEHVIIDIEKRPVEEWLYEGNYESDREFRKEFHQWLTKIWEEKDQKLTAIKG